MSAQGEHGARGPTGPAAAWTMAAVLAVAAAARVPFLADSLWYDEIAAFLSYGVQGPVHALTTYFSLANHVLQSAVTAASAQALGADELSLRLPSLLAGLGAVGATWWFARVAVGGAVAPWAAAAMALMPVAVLPSTEARGYAMVTLFAAVAHGAFVAARRDGAWRMWALWAVACALGTWTHLVTACVPAFHAGWIAWDAMRAEGADARRRSRMGLAATACAAGLAAIALAPVIPGILRLRTEFAAADGDEPTLLGREGAMMLCSLGGSWWTWSALAAAPLAAIGAWRARRDRALRVALAASLGPSLVALAFPLFLNSWLYARFIAFTVPGVALLIAAGAQAEWSRSRARGTVLVAAACAGWIACLATLGPRQPLREAVGFVATRMQPGERAVAVGLPDDVHAWYAVAAGIEMPGCGPYARELQERIADRRVRWAMVLYPRALAGPLASLEGTGWTIEKRFPGWIDGGDGEIAVLRRR